MSDQPKMKVVRREDIEKRRDYERSVEVAQLFLLMDRYPEKVREHLSRSPLFILTKQAA